MISISLPSWSYGTCDFLLKEMISAYRGEQFDNVEYVPVEEMYKYEIKIQNGLLYDYRNRLLGRSLFGRARYYIFVFTPDGEIRVSDFYASEKFHHSSLNRGEPVAMAGGMVVKRGKLLKVNNLSGHYKPSDEMLYRFIEHLRELGITLED